MITFAHPYAAPTTTLQLRSPQLGETEQYNIKTQFSMAMDGTVYGTIDTPISKTLLLTFASLTKQAVDAFIVFYKVSAGAEIQYIDHAGNTWQGVLINNPFEATTDGRKDGVCIEVSTVTVQFRGALIVPAPPVGGDFRILESGDYRLLESGDRRLLEA